MALFNVSTEMSAPRLTLKILLVDKSIVVVVAAVIAVELFKLNYLALTAPLVLIVPLVFTLVTLLLPNWIELSAVVVAW